MFFPHAIKFFLLIISTLESLHLSFHLNVLCDLRSFPCEILLKIQYCDEKKVYSVQKRFPRWKVSISVFFVNVLCDLRRFPCEILLKIQHGDEKKGL